MTPFQIKMNRRLKFVIAASALLTCVQAAAQADAQRVGAEDTTVGGKFSLKHGDGRIDFYWDRAPICTFYYRHELIVRPFFTHVRTPSGIQVSRNFPPIEGVDRTDHADMHPGVWLAFARLNDVSFWHNDGRVVHDRFSQPPKAGDRVEFSEQSRYVAPDGAVLCRQTTSYRIKSDPAGYMISIDAELNSTEPFYFGVREENGLGIRVATPISVADGAGSILNSSSGRNEKGTWGKVANWWDYSGVIDGRRVGMMVMSAPSNAHVWAHSRDYGFLTANPFPVDREENRDLRVTIDPDESLRLRFGVLVHEHDENAAFDRDQAYGRYVESITPAD